MRILKAEDFLFLVETGASSLPSIAKVLIFLCVERVSKARRMDE